MEDDNNNNIEYDNNNCNNKNEIALRKELEGKILEG